MGAVGGNLILGKLDELFRQRWGLPLLEYMQHQIDVLEDSPMSRSMNLIIRQISSKSLGRMITLTNIMMTNINQLQNSMECSETS
jgi:hypothetical protein